MQADESAPTSISAPDFLARVSRSHPGLEVLAATVDDAAANVRVAGILPNPALSYERQEVFFAGRGQPENYLRVELPLEISGRRGLRVQGTRLGLDASRASMERDRATLVFDAMEVYWGAAAARRIVQISTAERDDLGHLVVAVRARTSAGDASGYDLDRLELELETLQDLVAAAERDLDGWQHRLALLAGAPGSRLDAMDALEIPHRPPPLEALLQQALTNRADYRAASLRISQAERELTSAGRGWIPKLLLWGGAKTSAVVQDTTAWGYVAGLAMSVPVFDYGQGDAAKARAHLRQAQAEKRLIEAQVTTEVTTTYNALLRSIEQSERFERTQGPRLDRLVRRAKVSYQEGERPVFELLDAYRTARSIRARVVELRHQARSAQTDLSRALGENPGAPK